jgi:disulfide oxidoreductase YuzD
MNKKVSIQWLPEPEEQDYPAAESYLSLMYGVTSVKMIMGNLKKAKLTQFKAKDIFRASGLSLLGISNSHVEKDRKKIESGKQLSPILLVRDESNSRVIIADGYHRLCAVYSFNEDESIPCKIVRNKEQLSK